MAGLMGAGRWQAGGADSCRRERPERRERRAADDAAEAGEDKEAGIRIGHEIPEIARDRRYAEGSARIEARERFVETAYWNPSVVTGKDGKARVTLQGPDGAFRVPDHGAGRHRGRYARRTDDRPR